MTILAIRDRYGVPAHHGRLVTFEGHRASITGANGHYLRLRFEHEDRERPHRKFHPLWEMDYLDGVDHGAEYDQRVESVLGPGTMRTAA